MAQKNSLEKVRKIEKAREFLKQNGYFTDNLWCVYDVKSKYKCDDETAQTVLSKALENDATMEQIWLAIDYAAEDLGLNKKVK